VARLDATERAKLSNNPFAYVDSRGRRRPPIHVHAHEPETIYVVPITSDSEHYPPEGQLRVYRSRSGGNEFTKGLPQRDCYVNVLRDSMAVDSLGSRAGGGPVP
jgi:hypothetical protein